LKDRSFYFIQIDLNSTLFKLIKIDHDLKAGCSIFNAGCNEQGFSPKPLKKIRADIHLVIFKKNALQF